MWLHLRLRKSILCMLTQLIHFSGCSITHHLIYFACFCCRMTVIVVQDVDEFHTLLCGETQLLVVIPHLSFASRVWPFPGVSSSRVSCLDLSHRRRRTVVATVSIFQILWWWRLVRLPLTRRANYAYCDSFKIHMTAQNQTWCLW